jgi:hypothetical protein
VNRVQLERVLRAASQIAPGHHRAGGVTGKLGHDPLGWSARVEVHRQGDQIDGIECQFTHLVDGEVAALDLCLALSRSCNGAVQASDLTR